MYKCLQISLYLIVEKWAESYEEWPWANQPTFFRGGCILITGKSIFPLLAAIQVMPFTRSDDVYLTGLCCSKAKVSRFADEAYIYYIEYIHCSMQSPKSTRGENNQYILYIL